MSSGGGLRQRQLPGGVSTIGAVASYGPPDDFNNQPTTQADFGRGGHPPSDEPPPTPIPPDQSKPPEPLDQETEPAAWYRKPVVLIVWALLVLILIGLIVYGLGELIGGGEGTGPAPSTTPTTTTAPSSTTTTTTPPTSTTTPTTPPTSTAVQPPTQQHADTAANAKANAPPTPATAAVGDHDSGGADGYAAAWPPLTSRSRPEEGLIVDSDRAPLAAATWTI